MSTATAPEDTDNIGFLIIPYTILGVPYYKYYNPQTLF